MNVALLLGGLVLLVVGADWLVRGAARLASAVGVTPLVIGLTVVAFGTSAPELSVSIGSAFAGQSAIAVGNVVGSNVFNVLFILGLSALIVPLAVSAQLVRFDVPVMIAASALVFVLALDGRLGRAEGLALVAGLALYTALLIRAGRRAAEAPGDRAQPQGVRRPARDAALVVAGLALLVLGSRWLVAGAVALAGSLGVDEAIVGLTIVAAGTSLPEVVTSIVAAIRGQRDIAVGNVVGSNVFNLLGVLGCAAVVAPAGLEVQHSILRFDLPVMLVVAGACLPLFFTGGRISRGEGLLFLAYYVAYTTYLVLAATGHGGLPGFGAALLYIALPLTAVTIGVLVALELLQRSRG